MTETYVQTLIPAVDSRGHENLADESLVDANVLAGKPKEGWPAPGKLAFPRSSWGTRVFSKIPHRKALWAFGFKLDAEIDAQDARFF